jgi:cyclopropane-fatty-acyl-phospholipid synthase
MGIWPSRLGQLVLSEWSPGRRRIPLRGSVEGGRDRGMSHAQSPSSQVSLRTEETDAVGRDQSREIALKVLRQVFADAYARDFAIRLWDDSIVPARTPERFVLRINAPFALRAAFMPPFELNAGAAFARGWIDVDGDLEAAVDAMMRATASLSALSASLLAARLLRLPKPPQVTLKDRAAHLRGRIHSHRRDAEAIAFHYDQPVSFYRTFLDPALVYSCAYWDEGVRTLADAQTAKIDYILRKVRLKPGERVLDVGCGWGGLIVRAAERFGARAVGITLSQQQYEEAQRRIRAKGLDGRCSVELRDYRELGDRTFDKIVSVGMVEHVGRDCLNEYFSTLWKALRPGGLFLNHGIAEQSEGRRGGKATGFIAHYVFPDGELVALGDRLAIAERVGFEVRDVESLREHYARTLRAWVANLECNRREVVGASDEMTYRIWRLYLAGSAQGFASGRLGVFQSLLAKPTTDGRTACPPTRQDLYLDRPCYAG